MKAVFTCTLVTQKGDNRMLATFVSCFLTRKSGNFIPGLVTRDMIWLPCKKSTAIWTNSDSIGRAINYMCSLHKISLLPIINLSGMYSTTVTPH